MRWYLYPVLYGDTTVEWSGNHTGILWSHWTGLHITCASIQTVRLAQMYVLFCIYLQYSTVNTNIVVDPMYNIQTGIVNLVA